MSGQIFFTSDTHFGHRSIITFGKRDGTPVRPRPDGFYFNSIEEHDELLVELWNKRVKPGDKVYHLGDVVINRKALKIVERLNGSKRLVRGNHDIFPTKDYLRYFKEVYGVRAFTDLGFICSHIPLHGDSLDRWGFNVHGHLHDKAVLKPEPRYSELGRLGEPGIFDDPRYLCVSLERTGLAPISIDEVIAIKEERGL